VNQTVTFAPGETTQIVNVPVFGDGDFENNETFELSLNNVTNGSIAINVAPITGTIINDDLPTITVVASDAEASETAGNSGQFTLSRSGVITDGLANVRYVLSGTAANGADYQLSGLVSFAAGSDTAIIDVAAIDDNIFEGDTPENAVLTVVSNFFNSSLADFIPATYNVGTINTATINILDNDLRPTVTISNASQAEGNSPNNLGFNVTLSNPTIETVTVNYSTLDDTATIIGTPDFDPDYQAVTNGVITFAPGQTNQVATVVVNGDRDFEPNESFTVALSNAQNTSGITGTPATGTITNDDALPTITVDATNPISTEGRGEGFFTFYRDGGNLGRALTISFDILGNAATRQGYGARTGSVTFAAGSNTATFAVPVANNGVFNAYRGCVARLRVGGGYSIGGGAGGGTGGSGGGGGNPGGSEATVNIVDDDTAPVISINDVVITEGNSGTKNLTFTVSLSNASDDFLTVDYASADGTALAGNDYLATNGSISFTPSDIIAGTTEFTPGETSKTITVQINGDVDFENNEFFNLNLTNAVGGTLGKATGLGTITNDDLPTVTVSIPDAEAGEPNNNGRFLLTRSGVLTDTLTTTYTIGGTATAGNDYRALTGAVTFAANQSTILIDLNVFDDSVFEGITAETVVLTLTDNPTYLTGDVKSGTINIAENDLAPVITAGNIAINEGNIGTQTVTTVVSLSNASTEIVTVDFSTQDGTALVLDGDYLATTGKLTFAAGETRKEITVVVNGDFKIEPNETVGINFTNATNSSISNTNSVITINNDDSLPVISVVATNPISTEGTGEGLFTFTRTGGDLNSVLSIDFDLSGNATTRQGYSNRPGSVTFAAGSNTATLTVPVTNNNVFNAYRGCVVTLRPRSGYSFVDTGSTATVNIVDDDTAPVISINDVTISEGNSGTKNLTFTVSLSNASDDAVLVNYATANGTAIAGVDYLATNGTLSFTPSNLIGGTTEFTPGETSKTITVVVNGDADYENNETFVINLTGAVGGTIIRATGTSTIINDDTLVTVVATNPTSTEGVGEGLFTFTRTGGDLSGALTIDFDLSGNATTRQGYNNRPGSVTFAAGSNTATLTVPVANNNVFNAYRGCVVNLRRGNGYNVGDTGSTATVNIVDDEIAPVISINDVTVTEGNSGTQDLTFTISLSNASDDAVQVNYASANGTATAGSDYLATNGTLDFIASTLIAGSTEFTPGETSKTITVKVNGDRVVESNETFSINLTGAVGGTIGRATGTGTINNDDTIPVINVVATNPTSTEGIGEGLFTFTRTGGDLSSALTIDFDLSGNATTRQGYSNRPGSVTFMAGSNTATLAVPVTNNNVFNAYRGCVVNLRRGTGYSFSSTEATATVNIVDDEIAPVISINDVTVTEGNSGTTDLTFTISLNNASDDAVMVNYASANGTATAGSDYLATNGTLEFIASTLIAGSTEFTPGETSKTITIKINGDVDFENNEAFNINLTSAIGGTLGKATGIGTIINDDLPTVTISVPDADAGETNNNGQFVLTRTGVLTNALISSYTISGSATNGRDYQNLTGTATFAVNQSTVAIDLTPIDDNDFEGLTPETVTLTIADNTNYSVGAIKTGTVNIKDNENLLPPLIQPSNVLQLANNGGATTLRFNKISHLAQCRNELGVFTVDNDNGSVNGFTPGQAGYLAEVLKRSQVVFSALGETAQDQLLDRQESRYLNLPSGAKLGFYLVGNATTDDLRAGNGNPPVLFSFANSNNGLDNARFSQSGNITRIGWEDVMGGGDRDFNDLVVEIEAVSTPATLGANLQGTKEIVDLRSVTNQNVQANFTVQRDADYNNHVGFYKIEDAAGTVLSQTGAFLKPGDIGYREAVIQNRLTNIDLVGINGQATTSSSIFQGGAIYAPYLISNGQASTNLDFSTVFTAYSAANADKIDHIRLLGDNTFGFEDLRGGGDQDFNDVIIKANFTVGTITPQSTAPFAASATASPLDLAGLAGSRTNSGVFGVPANNL
jgi:disulfide oxidoreductase YuzD